MVKSQIEQPCAVIFTSNDIQFKTLKRCLTDIQEEIHDKGNIYDKGLFSSRSNSWAVALASASEGTAIETERAIEFYHPDVVLFVGLATGLQTDQIRTLKIGDVVVGNKIYNYEAGLTGKGNTFLSHPQASKASYKLFQRANYEAKKDDWLKRRKNHHLEMPPKVHIAPIATGSKQLRSPASQLMTLLNTNYNDTVAVETEAFGLLLAIDANTEVEAIVICGIKEILGAIPAMDAEQYERAQQIAADNASAFAFEILDKFTSSRQKPSVLELASTQDHVEVNTKTVKSIDSSADQNTFSLALPMHIPLDNAQIEELKQILCHAFRDRATLKSMVASGLNENLNTIASEAANLKITVDELVSWAEAEGNEGALILAAYKANSTHPGLHAFALQVSSIVSTDRLASSAQKTSVPELSPMQKHGETSADIPESINGLASQDIPTQHSYSRKRYLKKLIDMCQQDDQYLNVSRLIEDIYIKPNLTKRSGVGNKLKSDLPLDKIITEDWQKSYSQNSSSLDEILPTVLSHQQRTRWVIIGEAGLGKTTLLKFISVKYARLARDDHNKPLPVFIRLVEYAREYLQQKPRSEETQNNLALYLAEYFAKRHITITPAEVNAHLQDGLYLLLLDGLDEISNPDLHLRVVHIIRDTLINSECSVIVTSRNSSYENEFSCETKELSPFSPEQISKYIQQYFKNGITALAEQLLRMLESVEQDSSDNRNEIALVPLLRNPLFLSMMVEIASDDTEESDVSIPGERVELYDRYIAYRMRRLRTQWSNELIFKSPEADVHHCLSRIAYKLHSAGNWLASEADMLGYLERFLPGFTHTQYEVILQIIVTQTELLQLRTPNHYAFRHLRFQEFFAARCLSEMNLNNSEAVENFLLDCSLNPWWNEVIAIYYARNDSGNLLEKLLAKCEHDDDSTFVTHALLLTECLQVARITSEALNDKIYQQIRQRYYNIRYPILKESLFRAIGHMESSYFKHFLQDVYEKEYGDRLLIIQTLSQSDLPKTEALSLLEGWYRYATSADERREILPVLIPRARPGCSTVVAWFDANPEYADEITKQIIHTGQEKGIQHLLELAAWPKLREEISSLILSHLGKLSDEFVQQGLMKLLYQAMSRQELTKQIMLLNAIRFSVTPAMKGMVYSLLRPYAEQTVAFLHAYVDFLGYQARYTQEIDESLLSILLDDIIIIDGKKITILGYTENERRAIHASILRSLIQLNTKSAFEDIDLYVEATDDDSQVVRDQIIILIKKWGGSSGFVCLVSYLQKMYNQRFSPQAEAILTALCEINKRLLKLKSPVTLSPQHCELLFVWLQEICFDQKQETSIEALLFLLFLHGKGPVQTEIYQMAERQPLLGDILAWSLLSYYNEYYDAFKNIDPDNFVHYYIIRRPHSSLTYQLEMKFLAPDSETRRRILLSALKTLDNSTLSYALDMARDTFDTSDQELMQELHSLLESSDSMFVDKTINLLGYLGNKESEQLLEKFLSIPLYEDSAFTALFLLRRRLSAEKESREGRYATDLRL